MNKNMTIDREELFAALNNIYGKRGMSQKDVDDLCDFVLSFFGYENYVLDNVLSSAERDVFYNLEEFDLVSTYREEINIVKGKTWRINQWYMDPYKLHKIAIEKPDTSEKEGDIYDSIFKNL